MRHKNNLTMSIFIYSIIILIAIFLVGSMIGNFVVDKLKKLQKKLDI